MQKYIPGTCFSFPVLTNQQNNVMYFTGGGVKSVVSLYRNFLATNDVFHYIIRALLRLQLIVSLSRIIRSLRFDAYTPSDLRTHIK